MVVGHRLMTNRYFYPIYEEASRLGLAIALHIANANPDNCDLWRTAPGAEGLFSSGFQIFRGPTVIACHVLLTSELPHVFPQLRWGFIEASSQWVPVVCPNRASSTEKFTLRTGECTASRGMYPMPRSSSKLWSAGT